MLRMVSVVRRRLRQQFFKISGKCRTSHLSCSESTKAYENRHAAVRRSEEIMTQSHDAWAKHPLETSPCLAVSGQHLDGGRAHGSTSCFASTFFRAMARMPASEKSAMWSAIASTTSGVFRRETN